MFLTKSEKKILYSFGILCTLYIFIEYKETSIEIYKKIQEDIPFILFGIFTVYHIYKKDKLHFQKLFLYNKEFLVYALLIICFTIYVIGKEQVIEDEYKNYKLKESVKKAFIAFIIAYFASLDIIIAPFFLVFIFSFYTHSEWV